MSQSIPECTISRKMQMESKMFSPLVHSSEWRLSERKEFGVDDGEHGLTATVTVTKRPSHNVQKTLGQQEVDICLKDNRPVN